MCRQVAQQCDHHFADGWKREEKSGAERGCWRCRQSIDEQRRWKENGDRQQQQQQLWRERSSVSPTARPYCDESRRGEYSRKEIGGFEPGWTKWRETDTPETSELSYAVISPDKTCTVAESYDDIKRCGCPVSKVDASFARAKDVELQNLLNTQHNSDPEPFLTYNRHFLELLRMKSPSSVEADSGCSGALVDPGRVHNESRECDTLRAHSKCRIVMQTRRRGDPNYCYSNSLQCEMGSMHGDFDSRRAAHPLRSSDMHECDVTKCSTHSASDGGSSQNVGDRLVLSAQAGQVADGRPVSVGGVQSNELLCCTQAVPGTTGNEACPRAATAVVPVVATRNDNASMTVVTGRSGKRNLLTGESDNAIACKPAAPQLEGVQVAEGVDGDNNCAPGISERELLEDAYCLPVAQSEQAISNRMAEGYEEDVQMAKADSDYVLSAGCCAVRRRRLIRIEPLPDLIPSFESRSDLTAASPSSTIGSNEHSAGNYWGEEMEVDGTPVFKDPSALRNDTAGSSRCHVNAEGANVDPSEMGRASRNVDSDQLNSWQHQTAGSSSRDRREEVSASNDVGLASYVGPTFHVDNGRFQSSRDADLFRYHRGEDSWSASDSDNTGDDDRTTTEPATFHIADVADEMSISTPHQRYKRRSQPDNHHRRGGYSGPADTHDNDAAAQRRSKSSDESPRSSLRACLSRLRLSRSPSAGAATAVGHLSASHSLTSTPMTLRRRRRCSRNLQRERSHDGTGSVAAAGGDIKLTNVEPLLRQCCAANTVSGAATALLELNQRQLCENVVPIRRPPRVAKQTVFKRVRHRGCCHRRRHTSRQQQCRIMSPASAVAAAAYPSTFVAAGDGVHNDFPPPLMTSSSWLALQRRQLPPDDIPATSMTSSSSLMAASMTSSSWLASCYHDRPRSNTSSHAARHFCSGCHVRRRRQMLQRRHRHSATLSSALADTSWTALCSSMTSSMTALSMTSSSTNDAAVMCHRDISRRRRCDSFISRHERHDAASHLSAGTALCRHELWWELVCLSVCWLLLVNLTLWSLRRAWNEF